MAFLNAGGTILYRVLQEGETVIVDNHSVVAIEQGVTLGTSPNGRLCNCFFGGEGCCSTSLTGPGKVFLQVRTFCMDTKEKKKLECLFSTTIRV